MSLTSDPFPCDVPARRRAFPATRGANRWSSRGRWRQAALGLAFVLCLVGCGSEGPDRYKVTGTVTYNGQPVPVGEVVFEPDASQGNSGPGSVAQIKDGKYQTEPGMGVMGGAYIVRIVGFDGVPVGDSTAGTGLFPPYETTVNLPEEGVTQDFEVPAQGQ